MSARLHIGVRLAAYALLATLLLLPLLLHPRGCAFGLHDWSFPCYPEQARNLVGFHLSPWLERNLGQSNPAPQVNPLALVIYTIAYVAPDVVLRSMLWLFLFAAAIGADIAACRLFAATSPVARLAAGLVYLSSPFLATKLVSGHYFFLLGAALVPLGLVALDAIPNGGRRAWCAAAFCTSLAFLQLQVGLIMLALLPLLAWRRIAIRHWLGVWCAALLTFLPVAFAGISAFRGGSLSTEVQLAVWLRDESIPWNRVLDATYYFANYYGSAAGDMSVIAWQWLSPACVLIALLVAGTSRRLAFAAIVLGALATGATGPLAPLLVRFFAHITALSVFRELYDLLALAPLVVAGGAAVAIQYLVSRPVGRPVLLASSAGLAVIFGIAMWPAVSAKSAALVPLSDPRQWQAQVDAAAALPGDDRILWLPTAVPLGPLGTPGGADPFEYPTGRHPSAQSYHALGLFAYASARADRTGSLPTSLSRRLGIGLIVVRDRVVSRRLMAAAWPAGGLIVPPARPAQIVADAGPLAFSAAQPACEPLLRSAMKPDVAYIRCSEGAPLSVPVEDPQTSLDATNRGWVQGERWAELDAALAEPRWPVLFTHSVVPYGWMITAPGRALIYAPGGARLDGAPIKASAQWLSLPISAGRHTLSGDGARIVAISATLPISETISVAKAPALQTSLETEVPAERGDRTWGRYDATLPAHRAGFLILREGYSASWHGTIGSSDLGPPVIADGYANGWALPATDSPSHLSIQYAPLAAYATLLAIASIVWLGLLVGLLLIPPRAVERSRWSFLTFGPLNSKTGGMAVRVLAFLRALDNQGVEAVAYLVGPPGPTEYDPARTVQGARSYFLVSKLFGPLRWLRVLLRSRCVVITTAQFALTTVALRVLGAFVVFDPIACESDYHERIFARTRNPVALIKALVWRTFEWLSCGAAHFVLAVSDEERDVWSRRFPSVRGKLRVVGHGTLDSEAKAPSLQDALRSRQRYVLFVGNLNAKQNRDAAAYLVADPALHEVLKRRSCDLVLAGAGSERFDRIAPNVRGLGFVRYVTALISEASCCVAPMDQTNGVSTKIIDYMKYARCIVATPSALAGLIRTDGFPLFVVPLENFALEIDKRLGGQPPLARAINTMHAAANAAYGESATSRAVGAFVAEVEQDALGSRCLNALPDLHVTDRR